MPKVRFRPVSIATARGSGDQHPASLGHGQEAGERGLSRSSYQHLFFLRAGPHEECGPMQAALRDYAVPIGCMVGIVHRGGSLRARPTWERNSPVPPNQISQSPQSTPSGCQIGLLGGVIATFWTGRTLEPRLKCRCTQPRPQDTIDQ